MHWFRHDLRLADNPALDAAVAVGGPLVCVYVFDERMGGARRWWLHHSLEAFQKSLQAKGQRLLLRKGDPHRIVVELAKEHAVGLVTWNRLYAAEEQDRDRKLQRNTEQGRCARSRKATPRWAASRGRSSRTAVCPTRCSRRSPEPGSSWAICRHPCRLRGKLPPPPDGLAAKGDKLDDWHLLPTAPDWSGGFADRWGGKVGEAAAAKQLAGFIDEHLARYGKRRDVMGEHGTSRMSPHLHFGEISPRQIFHAVHAGIESGKATGQQAFPFQREVVWREFAHAILHNFPRLPDEPLRPEFEAFPWAKDPGGRMMKAWQRGRTGYPLVDAGMRELWQTGWMHNRARLVCGSFLTKDLMLPWQAGAAWFLDTLVDADLADNSLGWQWVSGCGVDASPYFRIFNPILQSKKFDPEGIYIRRWVPELAKLPDKLIHAPFEAEPADLAAAGVTMGETYPKPIVDHYEMRDKALAAYKSLRGDE